MPSSKYPLKPLLEHRERQVDEATAELGGAVRATAAAAAAKTRAQVERRTAEDRAERVRDEEGRRLAHGELTVADLARGQAWEVGARAEIDRLTRAVQGAEEKLEQASDEEGAARLALARRMTDRDVVAKDAGRFEERLKKRALAAEEEAAEEACATFGSACLANEKDARGGRR